MSTSLITQQKNIEPFMMCVNDDTSIAPLCSYCTPILLLKFWRMAGLYYLIQPILLLQFWTFASLYHYYYLYRYLAAESTCLWDSLSILLFSYHSDRNYHVSAVHIWAELLPDHRCAARAVCRHGKRTKTEDQFRCHISENWLFLSVGLFWVNFLIVLLM